MDKLFFAYFDFMHRHGLLTPRWRPIDIVVATAPAWLPLVIVLLIVSFAR